MAALIEQVYLSCTETAKLIRKDLKSEFPKMKFAVKSRTYSGGASIDIEWVDGPTIEQVNTIVRRYEGASFDPMTDMKTYLHVTEVTEEGKIIQMSYGADYIFCERQYSREFVERVGVPVARVHGVEPVVREFEYTGCSISVPLDAQDGQSINDRVNRTLHETAA